MRRLQNKELIGEFYNQVKDNYPGLTLEEFTEICLSPWRYLKQEMEEGDLPEVRFKYFGTFQVYEGRAKNMLKNLEMRFSLNKIGETEYKQRKAVLENYLNRIKDD